VHLVDFIVRIYHDARSSECQTFGAQLLIIKLKFYCFGYCNLTNLTLEFTDPEIIKLFVNAQETATHVAQPPGLRGTQFGNPCFN
jgi:hypothetical protein